ncbi:MAG: tRNA dihydrouridine(20/20a) synthase DusA [Azospirillaceae bacterium]
MTSSPTHRFCVAPMMDWTDRHDRFFLRLLSRRARLYTEMVTADAVIHGDRDRLLGFSQAEHPVALQLGGADPERMARAAEIGEAWGYDEININVGCPSDRVKSGRFGASLMAEPETVAACVAAMRRACGVPVTVKTRIGIDDQDPGPALDRFVDTVAEAGCTVFVIHARKAWLQGLSPKENRDVPPLDYGRVHALKARRPELTIVLNGGLGDLDAADPHLSDLDGVMFGRAAYQTPYLLSEVDTRVFGDTGPAPTREGVVAAMRPYIAERLAEGTGLAAITRHMLGLFQGCPGARAWRRHLSETAHRTGAGLDVVDAALDQVLAARAAHEARRAA